MSSPYRHAAQQRKLIYFGAILVLFTATMFVRGLVAMPIDRFKKTTDEWTIQGQSNRLDLNELNQGDADLTGSAVRLLLTGSRGLAICGLWLSAIEKQKREEWSEMDLTVQSIAKLQPHHTAPWLFQSWNLSYNVSVRMNQLSDMYFYISRGINYLAEGESFNKNNPDIRYTIGTYYQAKFTTHDKVTTLRCLFQLSCLPKEERNYRELMSGGQVNLEKFKAFCGKNPHLVRRLRETAIRYGKRADGTDLPPMYLVQTPKEVVDFLRENERLPNRFPDGEPPSEQNRLRQFPVLPLALTNDMEKELQPAQPILDGKASAVRAARAWYQYANEAIPLPNPERSSYGRNYHDPDRKRHIPKTGLPTLILFRQGPQRAQTYIAEQLSKDGWLDADPWVVDEQRYGSDRWFKEDVRIKSPIHGQGEWEIAHRMWADHGRANGLNYEENELEKIRNRARIYARKRGFTIEVGEPPPPHADELQDPIMADSIRANYLLKNYHRNLTMTNYNLRLYESAFEMAPATVKARKEFYAADRARTYDQFQEAIALYERLLGTQERNSQPPGAQEHMGTWAKLIYAQKLWANPDKSRLADRLAEETYEHQINYLRLLRDNTKNKDLRKTWLLLSDVFRLDSPASAPMGCGVAFSAIFMQENLWPALLRVEPFWPPGPFDGLDPDGRPWIPKHIVEQAQFRGLKPTKAANPQDKPASKKQ